MQHTSPFNLEWVDPQLTPVLLVIIMLAAVGTTILFCCGVVAYSRRRSMRYLLITVALGLLVVRSLVGLGTVFGLVPMTVHHLVEHGVDVSIAGLILYAVYRSGPGSERPTPDAERD
jgi:ethanolamine transporter EutH